MIKRALTIAASLYAITAVTSANAEESFKVTNLCDPTITKSIGGVTSFEREKYINISGRITEWQKALTDEQRKYLIEDLGIYTGRTLGMVKTHAKWGNDLREDPAREGYTDIEYLKKNIEVTEVDDYYRKAYGKSEAIALHDAHNAYPDYMPQYSNTPEDHPQSFPINNDAAGELVAAILKYGYDDFTRPKFYEPVNEPDWRNWKDDRFIEHHLEIKRHVDQAGIDVKVGGPCFSVSYFYNNNFQSLKSATSFIDRTENKLDFFSFHSYDYVKWDDAAKDYKGTINSGSALESVFDAIASHTYNKYGKEAKFVGSEHGGYDGNNESRKAVEEYFASKYFPDLEGFEGELKRREISNFISVSSAIANTMTFMNHPHIVLKSVPFILVETSGWDPRYYASMLVRENFDKKNPNFHLTKLVYFYEFFKGVEGERVHSVCDATDVQHLAYLNDNTLVLLYHNQSNKTGEILLDLNGYKGKVKSATIRRVSRNEAFGPELSEQKITDFEKFTIEGQQSIALFIKFKRDVEVSKRYIETPHYATEQGLEFKGSHTFSLPVKGAADLEDAILRVGISRKNGVNEGIKITLNGVELKSEVETSAERFTNKSGYVTTRIIRVPTNLIKEQNSVNVSFEDGEMGGVGAVVLRGMKAE